MPTVQMCQCSDPGCIEHPGDSECRVNGVTQQAQYAARRIDMDDGETSFAVCEGCADDMADSGVFAIDGLCVSCFARPQSGDGDTCADCRGEAS